MGLFDGNRSTASLASSLGLPVALVIDAYGMAETAGALVRDSENRWRRQASASRV